jgi:gluconokinase
LAAPRFFPAGLVATQFEAFEAPLNEPGVLRLDALWTPEAIAERVVRWMTSSDATDTPTAS